MRAWSLTDTGQVRKENQDCVYLRILHAEGQAFALVCDGMGGAAAGNVASEMAVDIIRDRIEGSMRPSMTEPYMRTLLVAAAREANREVFERADADPSLQGMGTTMTAALIDGESAVVANIGDSRTYVLEDGALRQVTRDHSLAADLLESGDITEEQYKVFPGKNIITRALGTENEVKCDIFALTVKPGTRLLLCSDGLTNMLPESRISELMKTSSDPETACRTLNREANEAGGRDNISVIVVWI